MTLPFCQSLINTLNISLVYSYFFLSSLLFWLLCIEILEYHGSFFLDLLVSYMLIPTLHAHVYFRSLTWKTSSDHTTFLTLSPQCSSIAWEIKCKWKDYSIYIPWNQTPFFIFYPPAPFPSMFWVICCS